MTDLDLNELKRRAKEGDLSALRELRERGFFDRPRRAATTDYPASHGQRRLWVLQRMAGKGSAYHIPLALRLDGPLCPEALSRSLKALVARHESLRTTFVQVAGELRQVIRDIPDEPLERIDLADAPDVERQALDHAIRHAEMPFDLEAGPLFKAALLRMTEHRHALLVNIHHAVADGWSLGVLVRDLAALYSTFAEGREPSLPPLRLQYKDHAAREWQRLAGPETARHLAYWRDKLADPPPTPLPLDFPRPAVMRFEGASVSLTLAGEKLEALRAAQPGTSLFILLTALVKFLLYRHTGQPDTIIGCPVAGRDDPDFEDQIGYFSNTLALRDRLDPAERFADFLAKVRRTVLEAFEHQALAFDRLVEELGLERDLSRSPLFDVCIALETADQPELRLGPVKVCEFAGDHRAAKFDLTFHFAESGSGAVDLELIYGTALFRPETARAMAERLGQLLDILARRPDQPLGMVPALNPGEWEWLARRGAGPRVEVSGQETVVTRFEARAAQAPTRIALRHGDRTITYGELNARAGRLAQHLTELGVGLETPVAVCARRSIEGVAGLLAVLKAGGAYAPLDPSAPRERQAFILQDLGTPVVLADAASASALPATATRIIRLDDLPAATSRSTPLAVADSDHLAYVIHTSGSTGRSKGVAVTHGGLMNLVRWHQRAFEVTPDDHATHLANPAFDASVWELWPYLSAGAEVSVVDPELLGTPEGIRDWLVARRVSLCFLPTPLAEPVAALPWPRTPAPRILLTGGDRLRAAPREGLPFRLVNNYGPTENSVVTTSGTVQPGSAGAPPLGLPIDNVRVYVLGPDLQPAPTGVPGELHCAGPGLARGYAGRPGLTAERYVPDPFGEAPGERLYKTGDLARWCPDGTLEFLGRIDNQIKIRGYRIESGEIEAALNQHPAVRESVVLLAGPHRDRLVAYVVPVEAAPDDNDLKRHLRETLPEYMVPTTYIALPALPLTARGKLDRAALPDPADPAERPFRPPETALERVVADIYGKVLKHPSIGVDDDFFALGGHSLSATQVLSRVREVFRVDVPLPEFFGASSVGGLALTLRRLEPGPGQAEKIANFLEKIAQMSDDEKRGLLEARRRPGGGESS
jgi:amino acid adenylation domain-containing protein